MKLLTSTRLLLLTAITICFSACTTLNRTMPDPNVRVELKKDDFILSEQVTASAYTSRVIGIDFKRTFTLDTTVVGKGYRVPSLADIPVIGNIMTDRTAEYALWQLMQDNPGYDVIFYPQYEVHVRKPILGMGFLYKRTTVKTTAVLGKLKR